MYTNAMQAMNALVTLPTVDTKRLCVAGSSQGGRLSVVVASLDKRVTAVISEITHFAGHPYQEWAKKMNVAKADGVKQTPIDLMTFQVRDPGIEYFDVVNFAPQVQCPTLVRNGLNDLIVSPSTTVYMVYQALGSKTKEFSAQPGIGHQWCPYFARYSWHWLNKLMKN